MNGPRPKHKIAGADNIQQCFLSDYDVETRIYMREGWLLFQAGRLADSDQEHCRIMTEHFRLPPGNIDVFDMGCGVGEFSIQLKSLRPDARCTAITNSRFQSNVIRRRTHGVDVELADYHAIPRIDESADVVVFCESFGYGDERRLLAEAFRLLRPGGLLCIKDFLCRSHPFDLGWSYTYRSGEFVSALAEAGFVNVETRLIDADLQDFERLWLGSELAELHPPSISRGIGKGDHACIWRAEKP